MALAPHRKSGIKAKRNREARRLLRDRKTYRILRAYKAGGLQWHYNLKEDIEPLSVYIGKPGHRYNRVLALFPVRKQRNGAPMPQWEDLSAWLKVQLVVLLLDEWDFQTFNIHIHPDLESQWLQDGRDVRVMMRDRLRRELDRHVRSKLEHFFVVEGWSKVAKGPTILHIHGGAAIYEPTDVRKIMVAVGRAAGHGVKGYSKQPRAVHGRMFNRAGPRY